MTKRGEHPSQQALEHMCKAMQERRDKGFISPMKGKTFEEVCGPERAKEIKARISELAHSRMMGTSNPFYGKHHTDETKRKISEFRTGKPNPKSEEARRKLSQSLKGRVFSQEHRVHISNAKKGKPSPWKGKHPTEETKRKMKEAKVGFIPWNKGKHLVPDQIAKKPEGFGQKISAARKAWFAKPENMKRYREEILPKGFTKERSAKISAASKGKIITVEMRSKISHKKKLQFADPKFKEAVLAKFWASCKKRPTSFEKQILTLIREKSLPFEYVGDGKLLIGCKNPDFIDTFGGHLIIETYYRALHPRDYEKTRKQYFEPLGYRILFLDEEDLKRKDWKEHCFSEIQGTLQEISLDLSVNIKGLQV